MIKVLTEFWHGVETPYNILEYILSQHPHLCFSRLNLDKPLIKAFHGTETTLGYHFRFSCVWGLICFPYAYICQYMTLCSISCDQHFGFAQCEKGPNSIGRIDYILFIHFILSGWKTTPDDNFIIPIRAVSGDHIDRYNSQGSGTFVL